MRTFCFILIVLIGYFGPFWLLIPCAFIYAMSFRNPYELLIPALFIDAQFGWNGALWGLKYTLGIGAALFIAEIVKPHLRFHTTLV